MPMMIADLVDKNAQDLLPIVMITAGMNYKQSPMYRPKGAEFHHIFYIEKGNGMLETPEGNFDLFPGMAVFMHKDIPMVYYGTGEEFDTAWITFVGKDVDGILDYLGAGNFEFLNSKAIYYMIVNAYKLAERGASSAVLSKCSYDILVSFFQELNFVQRSSPVLLRAKDFIEENYAKNISVSDIASGVGISESLVFHLFKDGEKTTPSDYLRSVRIRHAGQMLLSDPTRKIGELALLCGFFDAAYFCKVFKAETGMTPKDYRRRFVQ